MEYSSQKINKNETKHPVNVPESFPEKSKKNLEKTFQKLNIDEYLNNDYKIINNIKSKYIIKNLFSY